MASLCSVPATSSVSDWAMELLMQRRSSATKLVRRSLTVLGVALLAFLAPVSAASAHDALIGSSPEDGQTVEDLSLIHI